MSLLRYAQRSFSFLWRMLDGGRRIFLNLLFLIVIIFIAVGLFGGGIKKLDDKTALILDLRGNLVEQQSGSTSQLLMMQAQGEKKDYTQLRDVLDVLDAAAKDKKITSIVLLLDEMQNAGLPMLREVAAGLDRFKASGKTIVAWGSSFNQKQYFLAAHANEVYVHPMGMVALEGFGGYKNYYRDALDKLGITVNLMRVGTYKSFAEPYIANGPSNAASEAEAFLYNDLWATYTNDVEKARKLGSGSIMRNIDDLPNQIKQVNGDLAQLALNDKLVDGLKTRDELRQLMLDRGVKDAQTKSFRQVNYEDYLARQKPIINPNGNAIGVIVAEGEISDGMAPPGSIGGLSTANLIRKAREDDQIKALVLRIDSPGGSAFGSELIRRELEITRLAGKPVVVSMGNVAASGGYWISMSADEVFADAATITGSIGVFALLPTADKAMEKIGVHSAGTTTTWLRGGYDPMRPIDPRFAELIQQSVNHIYAEFTSKAAVARKSTPEKIDEVAQGRVWTGQQAKERGLVDTLGSYGDAIKSAAARAKLTGNYNVDYIEAEPTGLDRFFKIFDISIAKVVSDHFNVNILPAGIPPKAAQEMTNDMRWLSDMTDRNKAFSVVTHCMCSVP
ncbi:signal peptide peptidase SppA [Solimicrobium silvestre]|uniref:Signal peptide peptidase SppA, 67K type n=1 Tax=Solimicrobium silvestre TaxID=2099400 RepID=A0A2S9H3D9_9BURK|nr:signal peptide peptidase SppA [Solimicrobium silvestre]PRC94477.1 Signal peptide peptidase SppA, 67K type [Solimicrobium silvestre]